VEAVRWEGREVQYVNAAGKTVLDVAAEVTGVQQKSVYDANRVLREWLLRTDKVLILQGLSKLKARKRDKIHLARKLIKTLDDAHGDHKASASELIFIDYPSLIENEWENAGVFLDVLP
jgi:hypothetical protein